LLFTIKKILSQHTYFQVPFVIHIYIPVIRPLKNLSHASYYWDKEGRWGKKEKKTIKCINTREQYLTPILFTTNSMQQSPSWKTNSCLDCWEIPCLLQNQKFITVFSTAHHLCLSWTRRIQSILPYFFMIHFNNILPSMPMCPKYCIPMKRWQGKRLGKLVDLDYSILLGTHWAPVYPSWLHWWMCFVNSAYLFVAPLATDVCVYSNSHFYVNKVVNFCLEQGALSKERVNYSQQSKRNY
jgi:hypothetical protein